MCLKKSKSCHSLGLRGNAPRPCLYAGGVSVCTGLCQLTLICLISTSKSLTTPYKYVRSSFKLKPLSNTCLISRGPVGLFIMHLERERNEKTVMQKMDCCQSLELCVFILTFSGNNCLQSSLMFVCQK